MNNQISRTYRPFQLIESYLLVDSLLKDPESSGQHLKRSAASFIMSVVYGTKSLRSSVDPTLITLHKFLRRALAAGAGAYWVEFFHWLEYFPRWMSKWRRDAEEWFKVDTKMFQTFYDEVKARMVSHDESRYL